MSPPPSGPAAGQPVLRTAQDRLNAAVYFAPSITGQYPVRGLDIPESVALLRHAGAVADKDVLDIGIGTGRTTSVLMSVARRYVGMDYSEHMVRFVAARRPQLDIRQADMRDLRQWADASFDFALASNNVVDAVSHDDRLACLREVHRVLRPGAVFAFSTHNREAPENIAHTRPVLQRSRNPFAQLAYLRLFLAQRSNFHRGEPFHQATPEYVVQSDTGHDFACLHYYIDQGTQRRQLEALGFEVLDVIGRQGEVLAPGDPAAAGSASLLYVARRK